MAVDVLSVRAVVLVEEGRDTVREEEDEEDGDFSNVVVYRCREISDDKDNDDSCVLATMTRSGCRVVVCDDPGRLSVMVVEMDVSCRETGMVDDHAVMEFSTGLTSTEATTMGKVSGSERWREAIAVAVAVAVVVVVEEEVEMSVESSVG